MDIRTLDSRDDPYSRPMTSSSDRVRRGVWNLCWLVFFRPSPRPFHAWRAMLLRLFGAKLGAKCHFYPGSKVWAPWNLRCEDRVTAGQDGAEIYNSFSDFSLVRTRLFRRAGMFAGRRIFITRPEFQAGVVSR